MTSVKEINLKELQIHSYFLDDALSAVVNTILFVRAPKIAKPKDYVCGNLTPFTFATCGSPDVETSVRFVVHEVLICKLIAHRTTIDYCKKSLFQSGRYLKGEITISFYDIKEVKEYLGFVTRNENIYFERWRISITLLDSAYQLQQGAARRLSTGNQRESPGIAAANVPVQETPLEIDMVTAYRSAYDQVTKAMLSIIEVSFCANMPFV